MTARPLTRNLGIGNGAPPDCKASLYALLSSQDIPLLDDTCAQSTQSARGEACETSRYEYRAMKDGEILSRLQDEVERVLAPSSPARPPSRRARTEVATRRARSRGRSTAAAEAADRVKAAERCAARRGAGIERQRENERASSLRLLRMEDDGSSDRNSKCDFRVEKLFQNENDVTASVRTYLHES